MWGTELPAMTGSEPFDDIAALKRGIHPETVWGKTVSGADEVLRHKLARCV